MKIIKRVISILICSLFFLSCIRDKANDIEKVKENDVLPNFEVILNTGEKVKTSDLSGFVSVIVFFNSECSDCRDVLPSIQRLYDEFSEQKVKFLLISRGQSLGEVQKYWKENKYNMPAAVDDRSVYNLFATSRIPRIYISDCQRRVVKMYKDNPIPSYYDMKNCIASLLCKSLKMKY